MQLSAPIDCPQFTPNAHARGGLPTLSHRLLRLRFCVHPIFRSSRYLLFPGSRACWADAGEVFGRHLGFFAHGNTKKKTVPTFSCLADRGSSVLLFKHCILLALSGSLHERNLTRNFIGNTGPIGLQQYLWTLTTTAAHPAASLSCELGISLGATPAKQPAVP